MFAVTLPKDNMQGECKINGKPAEFRRTGNEIAWRYKADIETPWVVSPILHAIDLPGGLTSFVCRRVRDIGFEEPPRER